MIAYRVSIFTYFYLYIYIYLYSYLLASAGEEYRRCTRTLIQVVKTVVRNEGGDGEEGKKEGSEVE